MHLFSCQKPSNAKTHPRASSSLLKVTYADADGILPFSPVTATGFNTIFTICPYCPKNSCLRSVDSFAIAGAILIMYTNVRCTIRSSFNMSFAIVECGFICADVRGIGLRSPVFDDGIIAFFAKDAVFAYDLRLSSLAANSSLQYCKIVEVLII